MNFNRLLHSVAPAALLLAASSLPLTGCAPGSAMNPFTSYNIAPDDSCGQWRQQLKTYHDYFFSSMVQGAAMGAVLGGLAGYAIGGNATGALIGAGTGAVVGGASGYYLAKQKATSDPNALSASIYSDVAAENQHIDGVTAAFRNLKDCRIRSAREVKRDYQSHKLTQPDAEAKLVKYRAWFLEDITYAESLGAKMADRGTEYANASTQLSGTGGQAAAPSSSGGGLVAREGARVRAEPSTTGAQLGSLSPGESVSPVEEGAAPGEWTHIRLKDGREGYVASRLLGPPGSARASAAPRGTSNVAQVTETNQLKRKALTDDVTEAKTAANGTQFELSGSISRLPPIPWFSWQA
jgi:hypothetical protein